jgi:signal transduction histidine kinase
VRVRGTDLEQTSSGAIVVEDDGTGMSRAEFERGFLRIGARTRNEGDRRSARFGRRFTGAKGVGRLAAHKLAESLEITSWRWNGRLTTKDGRYSANNIGLDASIDWSEIEKYETLDKVESGLTVDEVPAHGRPRFSGTTLTLRRLRRGWTARMRTSFLEEVGTLVPLPLLVGVVPRDFGPTLLFERPTLRDSSSRDPGFELDLEDELSRSDELLAALPQSAILVIEIDCDSAKNSVRVGISPSKQFRESSGAARFSETIPYTTLAATIPDVSDGDPGPISFQARIYERFESGHNWPSHARGIRVYMEGFRVMPYGDATDDWLSLKEDYTTRARGGFLKSLESIPGSSGRRGESAVLRPYQAYAGAVFLRQNAAPGLQMVVNREGFLPGATLSVVRGIMRVGIDLATRVRYAATQSIPRVRASNATELATRADTNVRLPPSAALFSDRITALVASAKEARVASGSGDATTAIEKLRSIERETEFLSELANEAAAEQSMLRVLASLGTQLSAFSHEIGQLVPTASSLVDRLEKISDQLDLSTKRRLKIAEIRKQAEQLLRSVERQAIYLVDVSGAAGRRRRSRVSFAERFSAASRLVASAIERKEIQIDQNLPADLVSPPMFPAELTMVFTNLLTNAVKAAKESGKILVHGRRAGDEVIVRIENTGEAVDLQSSERWFKPFESRTEVPDAVLGQGMGLGLTITRSILDEYAAKISFAKPTRGYSTAVEIRFRAK